MCGLLLLPLVGACSLVLELGDGPPAPEGPSGSPAPESPTGQAAEGAPVEQPVGGDGSAADCSPLDAAARNIMGQEGVTVAASSVYSAAYGADYLRDGSPTTAWFAASTVCASGTCAAGELEVSILLPAAHDIAQLRFLGVRGTYATGYDVLTANLQLFDELGGLLAAVPVAATRADLDADGSADGDLLVPLEPPVRAVKRIRLEVLSAEGAGPGLGEAVVETAPCAAP